MTKIDHILHDLDRLKPEVVYGRVTKIMGLIVEVVGIADRLSIGAMVILCPNDGRRIQCEAVGFRDGVALIMPFGTLDGVGLGCKAEVAGYTPTVSPSPAWLGRVINALGEPLDGKGPLPKGDLPIPLKNSPPPANDRTRIGGKLDLGVRAINTFLSTCMGQRKHGRTTDNQRLPTIHVWRIGAIIRTRRARDKGAGRNHGVILCACRGR